MKMLENEIAILSILMKSANGLDAFTLFRRAKISFTAFTPIIKNLTEKVLIIEEKSDFFKITEEGKSQILSQKKTRNEKPWRQVPERFLGKKLLVNELYIPSVSLLDKKTFNNTNNELE
ncbi:hypothetical protein [Aliivibrio logei]|uniref:ArnR1-like winged helix-turn-helix domain-containing protein n=1 Tax=Aliivibrio logei TaxID=688 RepID=A0A1B9NZR3_ALILO|nr:hypothetical protein [Aliivibrio logei]OCH21579.1 hypothetical protein A6E04_06850 [Aliivibrio logei]